MAVSWAVKDVSTPWLQTAHRLVAPCQCFTMSSQSVRVADNHSDRLYSDCRLPFTGSIFRMDVMDWCFHVLSVEGIQKI